jgi:hypothetical protein
MDIPGTPILDTPDDTTPFMTPKSDMPDIPADMPDIPAPPDENQDAIRRVNATHK